jgi:hypothetical protein
MDSVHGGIGTDAVDSVQEARALLATRAHLLLTGPERFTSETMHFLRSALRQPVWETNATPLSLPTASPGTLIVRHAMCLAADDQVRLLQWIRDHRSTQLITITEEPLFPLVRGGTFLERLFYTMNMAQLIWTIGRRTSPRAAFVKSA